MRKDKGLNGDLDRLPMLTWIMFLKFLDDLEQQREERGQARRQAVPPGHRAALPLARLGRQRADGITGDELLAFINQEEATRPDGKRGPGLFAYLRAPDQRQRRRPARRHRHRLPGRRQPHDERLPPARRHQQGRRHPLHRPARSCTRSAHLYESMLREMRDAAGDSGEFYTPRAGRALHGRGHRPAPRRNRARPRLRHRRLPGRGLQPPRASRARPSQDRKTLQERSLFGGEAKPLPYLLCQMNLLLHGLDAPQIDPGNALRFKLTEIGEKDRVDVILTNPPFGGEEEKGIQGNFPEDKQTAETALLFLQLIMRKLQPPADAGRTPGARRRGRAQRHALRRWRLRPHQGGTAQGVQPPHHRPPAQRRLRALHQHPDEPALLRPLRPDARTSGTTSTRCPRAGRTTPRPQPHPVRGVRPVPRRGGASARRTTAPGRSRPPSCSPTAATSTARTRAPRRTSPTCRPSSSPPASSRRNSGSSRSWRRSRACSEAARHETVAEGEAGGGSEPNRKKRVSPKPMTGVSTRSRCSFMGKGVVQRGRIPAPKGGNRQFVAKQEQFIVPRIDARNGGFGHSSRALDGSHRHATISHCST